MDRGGAESMIMNYYRNIDREKVQFDFLVHRLERGAFDDEIEVLGGRIYRMPKINLLKVKKYRQRLQNFFNKHNDYTTVHSHLNAFGIFVLSEAIKARIPVRIAHSHIALQKITFKNIGNTSIKDVIKISIKNFLKIKIKDVSTHYFSCGEEAANWLFGSKEKNVYIINNAIDTKKFVYNLNIREKARIQLNLTNSFTIGHVGRFNIQKNHQFLIDIFSEILKVNSNCKLLLIGEGELESTILQKVKKMKLENSVIFLGVKSNISFYLQAMDVFLFPSLYEGLPVTLIEAQASGLPCIVSNSVSKDSKLTKLVEFHSLTNSDSYWAEQVLKHKNRGGRNSTSIEIQEKGYDIKQNALELQEFYLSF
jgi:glycosyltransferase involved in cell wall biosynthesis